MIPLLINAGADANHIYALDLIYCTPLTIAIDRGNIAMSRALIEAGADVNYTTDFRGDGTLVIVSRYGTRELCSLLLNAGADPNGNKGAPITPAWLPRNSR